MHHFHYQNGTLFAEDVAVADIAAAAGTPVYIYSTATITRHYQLFAEAMAKAAGGKDKAHVFYAMKANSNIGVVETLAGLGSGADVVSEGEIRKAMRAGIPASKIVFSGVGKTEAELAHAVDMDIYQINIETEGELEALNRVATGKGKRAAAVFRVNPDVGAGAHAKITTGSADNKFGVSFQEAERLYARAANMSGIAIKGLAVHIGSLIEELDQLEAAFRRMRQVTGTIRATGLSVERLDLGGGLGIPYKIPKIFTHGPDLIHAYADMVAKETKGLDVDLGFEPGRLIVGNAGILVTKSLYLNDRPGKTFLVVDAAMNDLVRPAMYEAYHEIWPVTEPTDNARQISYDVVGPICESGDTFTTDRVLPETRPGELMAFMTAGAYGASMASTYNLRPLVAEVMVKGDKFAITRPRQTYDDLIHQDHSPRW
ncbi:MAG: diaminopimelate decarboxylase [Beijerinckiaceae bacterium]